MLVIIVFTYQKPQNNCLHLSTLRPRDLTNSTVASGSSLVRIRCERKGLQHGAVNWCKSIGEGSEVPSCAWRAKGLTFSGFNGDSMWFPFTVAQLSCPLSPWNKTWSYIRWISCMKKACLHPLVLETFSCPYETTCSCFMAAEPV